MCSQEGSISNFYELQARANPLNIEQLQKLITLLGVLNIDGQGFSLTIELHLDEFNIYFDILAAELIEGVDLEMYVTIAIEKQSQEIIFLEEFVLQE